MNELVNWSDDPNPTTSDPGLANPQPALPRWQPQNQTFQSGNQTIREEFVRLVEAHGRLPGNSSAIDMGNATMSPTDDILGNMRDGMPDIGAFEQTVCSSAADLNGDQQFSLADLDVLLPLWGLPNTSSWDPDGDGRTTSLDMVGLISLIDQCGI